MKKQHVLNELPRGKNMIVQIKKDRSEAMDIHQIEVFLSVFKHRSFSKASQELNLTQPTISAHIKALENEFNCRLFDRLGRSIIPTVEAEILLDYATELIETTNEIQEAMSKIKNDVSGKLIIGASTIPGVYILPRLMSGFQEKYQSISFQIIISDSLEVIERIVKYKILLGIVGTKSGNEHVEYTPFMEDHLIAVASPALLNKNHMTLKELVQYPFILREEGSGTRKESETYFTSNSIALDSLDIAGIFGSTDAVKQAVKAGLGVSIVSKYSVVDELKHRILKEIHLSDVNMKRQFYIVTHKRRTLPKLYSAFLEYVLSESGKI
jgi:DNA-binding transcriptional LysR family regulator